MTVFYFKDETGFSLQQVENLAFYNFLINIEGTPTRITAIYSWKLNVIRIVTNDQGIVDFKADLHGASRQPHENIIEDRCREALIDLPDLMNQPQRIAS